MEEVGADGLEVACLVSFLCLTVTGQKYFHTPNANMADHSVAARDELYESEASEASVFCFEVLLRRRSGLFHFALAASFVFLNATRRE